MEDPLSGQGIESIIPEIKAEPKFISCEVLKDEPKAIRSGMLEDGCIFSDDDDGLEDDTPTKKLQTVIQLPENNFNCEICDMKYSRKSDLTRHMIYHGERKPYPCLICGRQFLRTSILKIHMKCHSSKKPHQCNICDKQFARKAHFTVHMRIHSDVKPYQCSICENQFLEKKNLVTHMKRHSGEKPYSCSVCDKRFVTNSELTAHVGVHTGKKPYQCSICKKQFAQNKYLNYHLKCHEKQYQFTRQCKLLLENSAKKVQTNCESDSCEPKQDADSPAANMEDQLRCENPVKTEKEEVFADSWECEEVGVPGEVTSGIQRPLDGIRETEPNIQSILDNVLSFQLPFSLTAEPRQDAGPAPAATIEDCLRRESSVKIKQDPLGVGSEKSWNS